MAPSIGWECSRCTYLHHAPGNRCVMCNELRVSKEMMRDFILGKKQKDSAVRAPSPSSIAASRKQAPSSKKPHLSQQSLLPSSFSNNSNATVRNPYARKVGGTTQATQPTRPPPPPRAPSPSSTAVLSQSTLPRPQPVPQQQQRQQQKQQQQQGSLAFPAISKMMALNSNNQAATAVHSVLQRTKNQSTAHATTTTNNNNATTTANQGQPTVQHKSKNPFTIAAQAAQQNKNKPRTTAGTTRLVYQPGPVPLAFHLADSWIYPTAEAYPKRQYQFEISQSAVLQNTLVSLPTGLGKTLIAAVVLYNYYRWFPTGKVIFLAPTLPLVDQQVQACYEIMGIPVADTAVLNGKVPAPRRAAIWQQKRVFFCTPQTVQKDLESGGCNASQVVCVVLDEAHKATGDYAYTKVIEYLERAGAKFRILGLSATPGTTIKAIQQIIDVLRINCIEARSDADSDVKQYIHERQTEVIVVKQVAASKLVERQLDEIIGPILDRLRSMGVLPSRLTGNATVTSFCLIKAREEFYNRTERDNSAIGYFAAGIAFIQLRADLHKHGIGIVRGKLHKMRTERQIGHTATIVKGQYFQALWDEVCKSSCDPDAVGNTIQDRLRNNPKMSKLREILTEHFERARACGTSSRAIIFSQFRDSVSEIVDVLHTSRPLILARQFVGQGKSNKQAGDSGQGVKGMRQEEQKKVIQEFRDNVHNTLVCTSIGEEGLDIGEVDIIINFDCLSSPIRMLQRVGRTGRKRVGRVVSLVAEGPEERTLAKSRQNERNLVHALKNPKSFTVARVAPMFPKEPVVCERNMTISQNFHMSQVDGAGKKKSKHRSSVLQQRKPLGMGKWKLSDSEEVQRSLILGQLRDLQINTTGSNHFGLPVPLRRRLVVARSLSISRHDSKKHRQPALGRTSLLLRTIEASHAPEANDALSVATAGRARKVRSRESALDKLFPLAVIDCDSKEDSAVLPADFEPPLMQLGPQQTSVTNATGATDAPPLASKQASRLPATTEPTIASDPSPPNLIGRTMPAFAANVSSTDISNATEPSHVPLPRSNPYAKARQNLEYPQRQHQHSVSFGTSAAAAPLISEKTAQRHPTNDNLSGNDALPTDADPEAAAADESSAHPATNGGGTDTANHPDAAIFRLPSQNDSSSDSSDDEVSVDKGVAKAEVVSPRADGIAKESAFRLPTQNSDDVEEEENEFKPEANAVGDDEEPDAVEDVSFRLPTPESSSSDEESGDDDDDVPLVALDTYSTSVDQPDRRAASEPQKPAGGRTLDESQSSEGTSSHTQRSTGHVRFSVEIAAAARSGSFVFDEAPDSDQVQRRKNPKKRALAVLDTPDSQLDPSPTNFKTESLDDGLSNTQDDDCENIVCAICLGTESPEEDPIVLCDGPGNGISCDVAVHVSCYSATVALKDDEKEWWCDRCSFLRRGDSHIEDIQCCLCGRKEGALKVCDGNKWMHRSCQPVAARMKRIRHRPPGGDQSKLQEHEEEERRRPLAHLSPNEEASDNDSSAAKKRRRREVFRRFIDDEADADSADDMDGDAAEEADALAMEEEEAELANSFINDSSQLGYTQDALDRADSDDGDDRHGTSSHRALDLEREQRREFATPALNRRVRERHENNHNNSQWSEASAVVPESDRGLGKMHFIRSVLEHHRNGGRAEEIEQFYRQLEDETVDDADDGGEE